MKGRSVVYALAVVVLMGTMGGVALADSEWEGVSGTADSFSSEPEMAGVQSDAGEIREPMETGAVPDRPGSSYDLDSNAIGDEPTVESGGSLFRPGIEGSL